MVKLERMPKGSRGPTTATRFLPLGLLAGPAGGIVTGLLSHWKLAIFALLIAFIGYQNYVSFEFLKPIGFRTIPGMQQDVDEAEYQVSVIKEQLASCEMGREKLKVAIATTNAQIDKWVSLTQKLQAEQTHLSTALIDLKKKSTAELEIILQGPVPQTCEGAVKLLRDAITNGDLVWKSSG